MTSWLRPVPLIIVFSSLLVLAGASTVLYQSLESERLVERARQERFIRNAAFGVVDELGSELFTMVSAFSYDLMIRRDSGAPINKQTLSDAIFRYRAQARFPELLEGLVCLVRVAGGTEYAEWTEHGWVTGERPGWADLTVRHEPNAAFSLENPVLTLSVRGGRLVAGEVVAVALRFSRTAVLEQIVPTLVRQQFAETPLQTFRAGVHNRSLPPAANAMPVDWEVPLLPSTSFDSWFDYYVNRLKTMDRSRITYDRAPRMAETKGAGGGWSLSVTYLPKGLEDEMVGQQARNLLLAFGFFFVLSLGFLGLYQMVRQAGTRAREERTFLALVSHELKTPLAVVRSLSENLARGVGSGEARAKEYGEILVGESERLSRMVGNVLALTAIQGGFHQRDLSAVDLGELVRDRASRQDVDDDVEVVVLVHPGLPRVLGHAPALSAAVDNLVGNAFRHGLAGPGPHRIRMVVEPRLRWRRRGVVFRIEDNGPGFTWSEGRSIFRPFRRGRRAQAEQLPGGGVGLSLVKTTALAMGGRLDWRSRPGQGTTFSLWLREAP